MTKGYIFPLNDDYRGFQIKVQTYGFSRPSYHDGVDFGTTFYTGRKCLAVDDGKVIAVGFNATWEIYAYIVVEINGHQMMYQEYSVSSNNTRLKVGDHFKKGDTLATITDGSHLHFGILEKGKDWLQHGLPNASTDNGTWLDPIKFLTGGKADGTGPVSMSKPTGAEAERLKKLFTENTNTGSNENGNTNGNNGGGGGGGTTVFSQYTLEVNSLRSFYPIKFDVKNIKKKMQDELLRTLNIKQEIFEPQLLTYEFSCIRLENGQGANYDYDINQLYPTPDDNQKIIISSGVLDSNEIHVTFENYYSKLYRTQEIIDTDKDKEDLHKLNNDDMRFNHGFTDTNSRSLTVISGSEETYLQQNKNKLEAQNKTFVENKATMDKQIQMNTDRNYFNAKTSNFNADMGFYGSMLNGGLSLLGGGASLLGGGLGLVGGANAVGGIANSLMGMYSSNENRKFTKEGNALNTQQTIMNNQQMKQAYNQNLRSFNASLKDVNAQPSSISQMGNDVSFSKGHGVDKIFIKFMSGSPELVKYSFDYLRVFGITTNKIENLNFFLNQRQQYNYIKGVFMDDTKINLEGERLDSIKAIFSSGVRVWNYSENIDNDFLNMEVVNYDKE